MNEGYYSLFFRGKTSHFFHSVKAEGIFLLQGIILEIQPQNKHLL